MSTEIPLRQPSLMDGATGTQLQSKGMPQGACTEQWILEHPNALLEVQKAYVAAGTAILTAPTFGANPAALARFGLEDKVGEYNRRLVALSREAAEGKTLVAGDLTTCGLGEACVREGRFEDVVDNYKAQVAALADAKVDLYLVETMMDMAEARAAVLAVRETDPDKPVMVSFFCDDEGRTPEGVDVLAALIVMQGMGVDAFGLNCMEPEIMAEQLERLAPYATIPLIAAPNGGEWDLAGYVERFASAGVRFFGACCGSTPEDIVAIGQEMDRLQLGAYIPVEQDPDVIPCASEREARFITPDVDVGEDIECTPDLTEDILDAEDVGSTLKILIQEHDDLDMFAENQYLVEDALCLSSDVPELLEQALRVYQGRAFWDGTGDIEPEDLQPLVEKYGLIIL